MKKKNNEQALQKDGAKTEEIILNKDLVEFAMQANTRMVKFRYRKKSGTVRQAIGTTNLALIPPAYWPKGNRVHPVSECRGVSTFSYFDRDTYDWRCFRMDLFEGYEEVPCLLKCMEEYEDKED